MGPRGGGGAGRLPVRRRGPGSPRAARRGAEQELREPPRSCASWPVGAVATPRRGRGGGAGRGARPGRAAAAVAAAATLLLAQPAAAAPAAVMAAVLSPRLCDSDPATPGAQSLKVRAGRGRRRARRNGRRGGRPRPRGRPDTPLPPGLSSRLSGEPGGGGEGRGWRLPAPNFGCGSGAEGKEAGGDEARRAFPSAAGRPVPYRGSGPAKFGSVGQVLPRRPAELCPRCPGTGRHPAPAALSLPRSPPPPPRVPDRR